MRSGWQKKGNGRLLRSANTEKKWLYRAVCVIGCVNRFDKSNPKSFYRVPKQPESRRKLWISAI
jgi:hypothetical protein